MTSAVRRLQLWLGMDTGFERLLVWQRARALARDVFPVIRQAGSEHDYALSQQLNSAVLSVMHNIAEGHERQSRKEFAQFLRIASGSKGETRSCLYAALDRGHVGQQRFQELCLDTREIGRMLQALGDAVRRHQPR